MSSTSTMDLVTKLQSLHDTAITLLSEFTSFQDYLIAQNLQHEVDLRIYRKGLRADIEALERTPALQSTLSDDHDDSSISKSAQLANTTNIPHYQLWWSLAQTCQGIRGLARRVPVYKPEPKSGRGRIKHAQKQGEEVQIDIMADDGQEWIKISSVSEKRLVFEMAKLGWEDYGDVSDSESDSAETDPHTNSDKSQIDDDKHPKLALLRTAEMLQRASRAVRVRNRHPRIHMILPNISLSPSGPVAALLADIRATGTKVTCGVPADITSSNPALLATDDPSLATTNAIPSTISDAILKRMTPCLQRRPELTSTLNIDTSILIALLSDQCHYPPSKLPLRPSLHPVTSSTTADSAIDSETTASSAVPTQPKSYHAAILAQMRSEEVCPLLPNALYPLFAGRELVCTAQAAERAKEIVQTMGTEEERQRAAILLPGPARGDVSGRQGMDPNAVAKWRALSSYDLPEQTLHLPIQEVEVNVLSLLHIDSNPQNSNGDVPNVQGPERPAASATFPHDLAARLHAHTTDPNAAHPLSDLNASVLFYGWYHDIVTVTSNGLAVRAVEKAFDEVLDQLDAEDAKNGGASGAGRKNDGDVPLPRFWPVDESRSLVGKEKQGQ